MVGPSHKKAAVTHIVQKRICSVRRACRYVGMPRSTYGYLPKPGAGPHQEQLHQRIVALSWAHHAMAIVAHPRAAGQRRLDGKS